MKIDNVINWAQVRNPGLLTRCWPTPGYAPGPGCLTRCYMRGYALTHLSPVPNPVLDLKNQMQHRVKCTYPCIRTRRRFHSQGTDERPFGSNQPGAAAGAVVIVRTGWAARPSMDDALDPLVTVS